ncbi:hypothetical protein N7512_005654 [Penicillium capsulatum]|nr:hypothetical protein N7512_005654 [Penicillium capsulatum]
MVFTCGITWLQSQRLSSLQGWDTRAVITELDTLLQEDRHHYYYYDQGIAPSRYAETDAFGDLARGDDDMRINPVWSPDTTHGREPEAQSQPTEDPPRSGRDYGGSHLTSSRF